MNRPVVALMYDFDKTLCTKDMQEYGFIPSLGMRPEEFWREVTELTNREAMDSILAYMYLMVAKAREKDIPVTREMFRRMGEEVEFFEGVRDWFSRMTAYGASLGLAVEHYIVSSGIREIIEGTKIAPFFHRIYACEFMYDEQGQIRWPKFAVNYTAKTQFLFRINKGVLDIDSESMRDLNRFTPEADRRVPFCNMIYIGDGLTDVPCMRLVKAYGGQSIAVHGPGDDARAAKSLLDADRVNYVTVADYREDSSVERIVRAIMKKISAVEEMRALPKRWDRA